MNLDKYGLPVQSDGDANDQLQRVGMILTMKYDAKCYLGLKYLLQPNLGLFTRKVKGNTNNVSADQLIGALGGLIMNGLLNSAYAMMARMFLRLGFAQNYVDGLNEDPRWKIPDFMFFRAMPLFVRLNLWFYPLAFLFDLYLIVLVIGDWIYLKTEKDPADINNTLITMYVCTEINPTIFSLFANWLWPKLRPNIYGWLVRYHRAEAGGNPEIAELWKEYCEKSYGKTEEKIA